MNRRLGLAFLLLAAPVTASATDVRVVVLSAAWGGAPRSIAYGFRAVRTAEAESVSR